jgi:hypothetical protein
MGVRISTEKKEELIRQQEEQRRKEEQDREEAKKLETTGFSIKNIKFTCADGTIKELGCGENGTGLELDYVVENVCADAKISFRMMEEGWIKIMGTNVKTIPVSEFETEVKQSRLFRYLAGINGQDQNYLNQMLINNKCERVKDVILLHEGGIMYGPYIMVAPMQYRVCIDVEYEGDQKPVLAVTDEYGKVRVTEKELKNGYNTVEFYLKEAAEKLEFVLYNTIEADIIVKSILLV